ncbi:sterol desaturase family protein [Aestuariivivens marinum]|uniref:sterol desaturase family protein n=1 Tax=Aestuariivivens marinum TaxID=2913555 RepID=UPI001F592DF8|nr:sterol desaturase family protein [Aestuariivivens marinum]
MEIPRIPDLVLYAIPVFIIAITAEGLLVYKRNKKIYDFKDTFSSLTMGFGSIVIGLFNKMFVVAIFFALYDSIRITTIPFTWWAWILIVISEDFCYYWAHRFGHISRFFWASHIVHHSSQKYNLSTATRQTWTGGFYFFIFYLILPLLGFHPVMIFTQRSLSLIYQYWIHTELIHKLPRPIEFIFTTPSHHRVHHGNNPVYLDRNYGGFLIIWDRLFGTFQPELKEEKTQYGLIKNIDSYNPFHIAFHEWVALIKDLIRNKGSIIISLKYLFYAPGWAPYGKSMTSKNIRTDWLKTKKRSNPKI